MNKIEKLLKLADSLDSKGMYKEANELDEMTREFKSELDKIDIRKKEEVIDYLMNLMSQFAECFFVDIETIDSNFIGPFMSREEAIKYIEEEGQGVIFSKEEFQQILQDCAKSLPLLVGDFNYFTP